jgi:hypothetical protein
MRFMTEDGEVESVRFDGYPFGDVALEGVMFYAQIVDGDIAVRVERDAREYLDGLDAPKLLADAKQHLLTGDGCEIESLDGKEAWLQRD